LLAFNRGHWGIENRLHWVLDAVLGEDRARARKGAIPLVLRMIRGAVVTLLRANQFLSPTEALRRFACRPWEALRLVCGGRRGRSAEQVRTA
jgi:hypothetical protein